ncbi:hypothetical protein GCM10023170_078800 [Phytohabitans houttuyneae]|uniref:hypothetical protein n=1 Tax=Phytohabitans houttuyneae TaxID=1076126 RepID=UPI0031E54D4B
MAEPHARQEKTDRRRKRVGGWREIVAARAALIEAQLESTRVDTEAWRITRASVHRHLRSALEAADRRRWFRGTYDWWTGAHVTAAWAHLHNAELLLVSVAAKEDLSAGRHAVIALLEQVFSQPDPRRAEARRQLIDDWPKPDDRERPAAVERAAYRTALQWGFTAADEQYARVRSLRNLIIGSTLFMLALVLALAWIGAAKPDLINLCFTNIAPGGAEVQSCPAGASGPSGWDVFLVELLGLVGGSLSAMVAIRGMRGTSTPYGVPVALALLKLPAGALVSLTALLLLGGEFFPGLSGLDSPQQIVAYALVLGYAQQLVTRLVDRQANTVLDRVPSAEPVPREQAPPATPPAAAPAPRSPSDALVPGNSLASTV